MKKLILIAVLIIIAGIAYGQTFKKGNRFSVHVVTVTPAPNVTVEQFLNFYKDKIIPELEKNIPESKYYIAKSIRGECANCWSLVSTFKSKKDHDKYFNEDGSQKEIYIAIMNKLKPLTDEWGKMGTYKRTYTTWEIQ